MNKVLFVQQYLGENHEVGPLFPIGLAYLATSAESIGWQVRVVDMNLYKDPYGKLNQVMASFSPSVVGISLRNVDNVDYENFTYFYPEIRRMTVAIKKYGCKILVGGAGFSIFAKAIFEQNSDFDYGIVQEGEETIMELLPLLSSGKSCSGVKGVYHREQGIIQFTGERPPLRFVDLPIPSKRFFDMSAYDHPLGIGVQTKRGCSLRCSYCVYPYLNKHSERFRRPEQVVDEIKELVDLYSVHEIIFCDDIFNVPVDHCLSIIKGLKTNHVNVKWSAWFDVKNIDLNLMREAIASGCYRFCFSTDGSTDKCLSMLGKDFTVKDIRRLLRICFSRKFKDIDFRFSLFSLPPGQSLGGMLKTLCFVFKTHVVHRNSKCLVSSIRILPNTGIYKMVEKERRNLLPEVCSHQSQQDLFYREPNLPHVVVSLYEKMLSYMDKLRKIRKRLPF